MKRYFKDYAIDVTRIEHPRLGSGYRAEFFIPKTNGLKSNVGAYETYDKGLTHGAVLERVQKIIEVI